MLYTQTVEPGTFSLLKKLMELPSLLPFSLVGGTALALRYRHHSSDDLDLFFHEKFDHESIENDLINELGENSAYEKGHKKFGIFCHINKIKVDIAYFPHLPTVEFVTEDQIRI